MSPKSHFVGCQPTSPRYPGRCCPFLMLWIKRAAALRRVGIVLVRPRPAGLRIISGFWRGDGCAQGAPAGPALHAGAVLRQPKALGSAEAEKSAQSVTAAADNAWEAS